MPVRVSVVIPSYNTARYISEALDSVNRQLFQSFETIVINDGSPDTPELERVLEPYQGRITYISKSNQGVGAARNTGIQAAKGSLIAFLDSDDVWEPGFLQVLVRMFDEDPKVDVIYSNAYLFGETNNWKGTLRDSHPTKDEITFEGLLLRKVWVFSCASMVRTEALVKVGGYDANLRFAEDLELWLRIAHGGGRFMHTSEPLVGYRRRPDSLTSERDYSERAIRERIAMYEGLIRKLDLRGTEKQAVDYAINREKAEMTGIKPAVRRLKRMIRTVSNRLS
jgi:glycosyltransferase involved in cell wall biosynthesis